jgi:hypothetical protein
MQLVDRQLQQFDYSNRNGGVFYVVRAEEFSKTIGATQWEEAEAIQNHEKANVHKIGRGEPRLRK